VGVIRASKFAKYLPDYGWEPVILTAKPDTAGGQMPPERGIKVFRTEYKDVIEELRRFLGPSRRACKDSAKIVTETTSCAKKRRPSLIREMISMPDDQIGWYNYAVEAGKKIADKERPDLVFSTSPPETAHLVARALKRYRDLPWVADFRDLWAYDHFRRRPRLKKAAMKVMEARVLKSADAVVTVSAPWAKRLESSCGASGERVKVIENAFDEEDFEPFAYSGNNKFTISYTGKLHADRQSVDAFFRVLSGLAREGLIRPDRIDVRFYISGYDKPDVERLAESYGLGGIVREFESVSYNESHRIQRSSDLLLFVQWQGESADGWYSAKLYDYLGARRPILALGRKGGIIDDLIQKTSSGVMAQDERDLRRHILDFYGEYMKTRCVAYKGDDTEVSKNTRAKRTEELAGLFNSLCAKKGGGFELPGNV
jgi:glycosyltransferase involved in cell wall biosynthesis